MKLFKLFGSKDGVQAPVRERLERVMAEPLYARGADRQSVSAG